MKNSFPPLLIDLDGVLRFGKIPAPDIKDFLGYLEIKKINACILSNTTQSSSRELLEFFDDWGIKINFPLITAADATLNFVRNKYKKAALYAMPKVKALFEDMLDYKSPEVIVMGDLGSDWNYDIMNEIFNLAHKGIPLIAMQKNKFWKTPEEGLLMDLGAIVKAIEYAADVEATLIGKPSPLYFEEGLKILGAEKGDEFLMVGDDLVNDIHPVQKMKGKGILVYTGKTEYPLPLNALCIPDYEAHNLMEVIDILNRL